jgi:hypothetical protein
MTGMKSVFAVVLLTAIVGVVPRAQAATNVKIMIAGSSAIWQHMALAAYNTGKCVSGGTAPCFHYTGSKFSLSDTRPATKGGTTAVDGGSIWIVWDSNTTATNVWAYIKVDSVVGTRCYFAQPRCNVSISSFPAPANSINSKLWGNNSADSVPPAAVSALFSPGNVLVNTAATDIRPEDGLFAQCRANSVLGGGRDGFAGLGYGVNSSGVCPAVGSTLAQLSGNDILSGAPGSTSTAHPLAFNISGNDPYTSKVIPAATTVSVGAAPVIFITQRTGALAGVTNATDAALQAVFSGTNCNASAFGAASAAIQAYLREPLSGTMNTTEYTVFRRPNQDGKSQEANVGSANPLSGQPCPGGGGKRTRSIGTGEEVKLVHDSVTNFGTDGIGYTFFSFGNVSSIASSTSYRYLQLDGVDGIFSSYTGGDPGEPGNGTLPGSANLPAVCAGTFPCSEKQIWTGGQSFPHLRDGTYRAWSTLRLVSDGTALTVANLLATGSATYAVNAVPDYVPVHVSGVDPGLKLVRSHYGPGAVNSGSGEKGRDAGGCILHTPSTVTQQVQEAPGVACSTFF